MAHNLVEKYSLPLHVQYCKRCTMSNQRPRITFIDGVCSACLYADYKKQIDWNERELELKDLCDRYRKGNGEYDVIVPSSGGKDSGFVAHQLKYVYGMTPLTVTWAPLKATEIGRKNLDAFIDSGFDNVLGKPNGKVTRRLTALSTEYLGDPFQPFIYGQTNFPRPERRRLECCWGCRRLSRYRLDRGCCSRCHRPCRPKPPLQQPPPRR